MELPEVATQICSLRFSDGAIVAAEIEAGSPYEDGAVRYSGPVERIPVAFPTANAVLLRALFQSFARELGATFCEGMVGNWERYAADEEEAGPDSCQKGAE